MLKHKTYYILVFIITLSLFSCVNKKKIIYFQGDKAISNDTISSFYSTFKIDDLLTIIVTAIDAEAVKPFNLATYGNFESNKNMTPISNPTLKGYLIDSNGEIDFPVIGKLKVAGLNKSQASNMISEKLKIYLKDPVVHIEIQNFKITILGDVNRPGSYTIPHDRITILEAIGMAGDLNITGMRKNILVVRDNDGKKTEFRVDLTNKELFNSPVFYLQQNDLIYVEPNRPKKNTSAINSAGLTLVLSITTLGITLLNLLIK